MPFQIITPSKYHEIILYDINWPDKTRYNLGIVQHYVHDIVSRTCLAEKAFIDTRRRRSTDQQPETKSEWQDGRFSTERIKPSSSWAHLPAAIPFRFAAPRRASPRHRRPPRH